MHFLKELQRWLRQEEGVTRPLQGHRFHLAYPDLHPASGGTRALADSSCWQVLRAELNVEDAADYVKRVLNKREGEAKFVEGNDGQWREFFPDSVGMDGVQQSCFWQYQFCRQQETRQHLWKLSLEREDWRLVFWEDIDWIVGIEGNELTLLRCEPQPGERPSSGGTRWFIRIGKYVTLAEAFQMGRGPCTCFDLYRTHCNLPTAIFKRKRGESRAAHGTKRANAKLLRHIETGRWGLPW